MGPPVTLLIMVSRMAVIRGFSCWRDDGHEPRKSSLSNVQTMTPPSLFRMTYWVFMTADSTSS